MLYEFDFFALVVLIFWFTNILFDNENLLCRIVFSCQKYIIYVAGTVSRVNIIPAEALAARADMTGHQQLRY